MAIQNLSTKAYQFLHDEIVSGKLSGGTIVSEAAIAKRLGISRTPVGEAVRQLVREGLVEQVPRFGTVVRKLTRSDLIESYELREALETYVAAQAAVRGTPEDLARITSLNAQMGHLIDGLGTDDRKPLDPVSLRQFLAADMAFHLAIVQAAGNRRIAEIITVSRAIFRIFSTNRVAHDVSVTKGAYAFHKEIAKAILAHDPTEAAAKMADHIRGSQRRALESFDLLVMKGESGPLELPTDVQNELNAIEESMRLSKAE